VKKNSKLLQDLLKLLYEHQERIVKLERFAREYCAKEQEKPDSFDNSQELEVYLLQRADRVRTHLETHDSEHVSPLVQRIRKSGTAS
jgi:hypothetical protein